MELDQWSPSVVTAATSVLMVVIWIAYLQLALMQFRRASRPFLIIHHAHENAPSALCMFVNMSQEPVHLECVLATITGEHGTAVRYVVDYHRMTPDDRDVQTRLRQGPIQPGGYLVLGSFADIILGRQSNPRRDEDTEEIDRRFDGIEQLSISVAVTHGPSKSYIGASRQFFLEHGDGQPLIRARSIHTEQLVHWPKRRRVRRWIEARVQPRHTGSDETSQTEQSAD
ncbi:MAG: hypothetical protein ACOCVP_07410 [Wenzhouxiangella sp.]